MTVTERVACPGAETIAALAEGRIADGDLDALLAHVETCASCTKGLEMATGAMREESIGQHGASVHSMWWLAAAAAVVLVIGGAFWRSALHRGPDIADLAKVAPHDARLVEARLSGPFGYAPYRGTMRASGSGADSQRLRVGGVAANAIDRADADPTAETQHVAGVALLLADDPSKSIDRLRAASERAPNDVRIANDLAAARYAAAETLGRASLIPEALAAVDQALRIDPNFAEALFNRALILERMGLGDDARRAWERYLAVESSSPWADEARRRLARVPHAEAPPIPRLERAIDSGNLREARAIVAAYPQHARTFAEAEHLGRWGEATLRGDRVEAARLLTIARSVGDALAPRESLLRDAVAAIDPDRAATLARAHSTYREGRIAYSRAQLDDASRDFEAASEAFAAARSPMMLVSRYYAASARYDRGEIAAARATLEEVGREADAHPTYASLRAQIRWELALCSMAADDWTLAIKQLTEAEALFAALGERANLASIQSMLATALMSAGRPDDAWSARMRGFEAMSAEGKRDRVVIGLSAASRMEQRAGRADAARALLAVEVEEARASGDAYLIADALIRSRRVGEALAESAHIEDRSLRARAVADARAAEGVMAVDRDPRRAIESLSAAIAFYDASGLAAFLPGAYLHRARAELRVGNAEAARTDLDNGIAQIEKQPLRTVLDDGDALFEDAIHLSLARGDAKRAFEYAERIRAPHAVPIETLQQRLRGTTTAVLELTTLPDEVIAFAVGADDFSLARSRLPPDVESQPLPQLYDVLIRPSARIVDRASDLIVVPDRRLERVPFAALYDSQRRASLIERVSVATARSASELEVAKPVASRAAVLVALPATDRALPEAAGEIDDVAPLYAQSKRIAASDATYGAMREAIAARDVVLHIAGHTVAQRGEDDSALRFNGDERATWSKIAADPLDRGDVVVLAACNTLRASTSPQIRSLSLGAAFIAAGAGNVFGTLTPIGDADARELFLSIHKGLAAGASPAQALRRAQLDALASGRLPAWQSIALMTRCINVPR